LNEAVWPTLVKDVPITDLMTRVEYLPVEDRTSIRRAFDVADRAHTGQSRLTGEPYIEHPSRWRASSPTFDSTRRR